MANQNLAQLRTLKDNFKENIKAKTKIAERLRQNYVVADGFPDLKFKTSKLKDNYLKYAGKLLVKDLVGSCVQGITVLEIIALKDVEFEEHTHIKQSQTVYVKKGKIINLIDNLSFSRGQSFFTSKDNIHKIKYLEGSEIIIIYTPNLEVV